MSEQQKVSKAEAMRQALQTLGYEAPNDQIRAWIKERYGFDYDSTFSTTKANARRFLETKGQVDLPVARRRSVRGSKQAVPNGGDQPSEFIQQMRELVGLIGRDGVHELVDKL